MKFFEGEIIEVKERERKPLIYQVREGEEGEPMKHLIKKSTGEVSPIGRRIKITDNIINRTKKTGQNYEKRNII